MGIAKGAELGEGDVVPLPARRRRRAAVSATGERIFVTRYGEPAGYWDDES